MWPLLSLGMVATNNQLVFLQRPWLVWAWWIAISQGKVVIQPWCCSKLTRLLTLPYFLYYQWMISHLVGLLNYVPSPILIFTKKVFLFLRASSSISSIIFHVLMTMKDTMYIKIIIRFHYMKTWEHFNFLQPTISWIGLHFPHFVKNNLVVILIIPTVCPLEMPLKF